MKQHVGFPFTLVDAVAIAATDRARTPMAVALLSSVLLAGCQSPGAPTLASGGAPNPRIAAPAARASTLFVSGGNAPLRILALAATSKSAKPLRTIGNPSKLFGNNFFITYDAPSDRLWLTNCPYNRSSSPVVAFDADATGDDVHPDVLIHGSKTTLSQCQLGIGVDRSGYVYVSDQAKQGHRFSGQVAVFAPGQQGDVAPSRRIAGIKADFRSPSGLAIDARGRLYVGNTCFDLRPICTSGINIYAPGASGDVAPIARIEGPKTGLYSATGLAFDSSGYLYVSDYETNRILVFAPNAKGDVAPVRIIAGGKTHLRSPSGIAVDGAGYIYVGNIVYTESQLRKWPLLVFAPDADGDVAPVQSIVPKVTPFVQTSGVALR
ncbi:MAG TPA: hypothetical protein VMH02_04325 [Verrucomicrobiae bacterium]|nr:hypothetical protein [Verrucomicrobiae bacterium]